MREGQITETPTDIVRQVETEMSIYLLTVVKLMIMIAIFCCQFRKRGMYF
jgi:hypothetical protein